MPPQAINLPGSIKAYRSCWSGCYKNVQGCSGLEQIGSGLTIGYLETSKEIPISHPDPLISSFDKYMRIHVTGNAGSGKSTFAKNIGDMLGINVYGLDKVVWKEGWQKTALDERKRHENELGGCPRMHFCPNSALSRKNNARNIKYMSVLIFSRCLDFEQNYYSRTTS